MIYLFREAVSVRMWEDLYNQEAKEGWCVISHDSDSLTQLVDCLSDVFSLAQLIGFLEHNLPQLQRLPLLCLSNQLRAIVLSILDLFLIQILRNELNSSLTIIHSFDIIVEGVVDLGESLLTCFGLCLEGLNHLVQQADLVEVEHRGLVDNSTLFLMCQFRKLLVEPWDKDLFWQAMCWCVVFSHDWLLKVLIHLRVEQIN